MFPFVVGGLFPALFLAYYNNANFGSPFTLSYAYALNYPWAGSFRTTFDFPLLPGLQAMLLWGRGEGWCNGLCYNQGLFLLSPVLLLAVPGFWLYYRRQGGQALLITAVFLIYLLLFARHRTFHGFTGDGRYLAPFLPLLGIPIAFSLTWAMKKRPLLSPAYVWLLIYALFFLSWRNIALHIGLSYNYTLTLAQLEPLIASPANWLYFVQQILPNLANLPLLWGGQLIVGGLFIFTRYLWLRIR